MDSDKDHLTADPKLVKVVTRSDLQLTDKPFFLDGKFVDDENLLLVDHDNHRLLLLSKDFEIIGRIQVMNLPTGLALSQDRKGVYVVCNCNVLLLYSLEEEYKMIMKIDLESGARGVAVCQDRIIIGYDNHVMLYDPTGKQLHTIPTVGNVTSIAVNKSGDMFYHRHGDQIIGRDKNGEIVFQCSKLCSETEPVSISVDCNGGLCVVEYESMCVRHISKDGLRDKILIENFSKMYRPRAIVCHPSRPCFVVMSDDEDNALEKYRFSPDNL